MNRIDLSGAIVNVAVRSFPFSSAPLSVLRGE